jgi:hypothetical protein
VAKFGAPLHPYLNVTAKLHDDPNHLEEVIMRKLSSAKCSGIKRPFKLEEIWRIRTRLEIENDLMQLSTAELSDRQQVKSE